ncbi:MAG: DUF72 domain-containing protein [Chthoniobacteraceae bacterium]
METTANIYIGTCAWSYDDWRENFYPEGMGAGKRLEFYAQHFKAVEVDSTFYAPPSKAAVQHWHDQTPEHFRFCCKVPKLITHELRLRDCEKELTDFLSRLEPLGEKLGMVLVQLPASFKPSRDEESLRPFLRLLPRDIRFAIEFREAAWNAPRITEALLHFGVSHAWSDMSPLSEQDGTVFGLLPQTSPHLYIRLMGDLTTKYKPDGSRIHRYGHLMWPRDEGLESWATKIRHHVGDSAEIYAFCANHYEGSGPLTARRLSERLGMAVPKLTGGEHPESENQMLLL